MEKRINLSLVEECLLKGVVVTLYPRGMSMEPFIKDNEKILVRRIIPEKLNVGDVVVFYPEVETDLFRVHRIIKHYRVGKVDSFLIKGDACFLEDGIVEISRIVGKVVSVIKGRKVLSLEKKQMRLFNYLLAT